MCDQSTVVANNGLAYAHAVGLGLFPAIHAMHLLETQSACDSWLKGICFSPSRAISAIVLRGNRTSRLGKGIGKMDSERCVSFINHNANAWPAWLKAAGAIASVIVQGPILLGESEILARANREARDTWAIKNMILFNRDCASAILKSQDHGVLSAKLLAGFITMLDAHAMESKGIESVSFSCVLSFSPPFLPFFDLLPSAVCFHSFVYDYFRLFCLFVSLLAPSVYNYVLPFMFPFVLFFYIGNAGGLLHSCHVSCVVPDFECVSKL
jgi:hypothetical protein